jgi:hypothetical protein
MKKTTLILGLICLITTICYAQIESAVIKNTSKSLIFKNTLFIGYNFYTFDNTGWAGLYPTFYTLNYRHFLKKKENVYWELGWNYFYPVTGGFIYTRGSAVPYSDKRHIFNTVHSAIGKRLLNNTLGASIGLNYKYGIEGELKYVQGVGYGEVTYIANSAGLNASLNYQFILGKRFVIEPIARYECYFEGVTSHYMIGLNAGYNF